MKTKQELFTEGKQLLELFCTVNHIPQPEVIELTTKDRLYYLATCAFYRPDFNILGGEGIVRIMVNKCAGMCAGGCRWSCPGHKVDRTPYGVLQHELGHHVDWFFTRHYGERFSESVYTKEKQLTGYVDKAEKATLRYYSEWFAEHFRLFVTNPDLSKAIAPKFFGRMTQVVNPVVAGNWLEVLTRHNAPERTTALLSKLLSRG